MDCPIPDSSFRVILVDTQDKLAPRKPASPNTGAWMHETRGRYIAVSPSRRIIMDLMHEARQVPSIPVQRRIEVQEIDEIRKRTNPRVSWFVIFMKAFALVAEKNPQLRRSLIKYPWCRFYDHPISICSLAIERDLAGEPSLFFAHFRAPEEQSLVELQDALKDYKDSPIEQVGLYRRALKIGKLPTPLRRLLWWSTLNFSGAKRAKRLGTFGLTSYGALGAESLHPISPLTCTFNFGPISRDGKVLIKIIYDHRTLDGSEVARRLKNIEEVLHSTIKPELAALAESSSDSALMPKAGNDVRGQILRQDSPHAQRGPNIEETNGIPERSITIDR